MFFAITITYITIGLLVAAGFAWYIFSDEREMKRIVDNEEGFVFLCVIAFIAVLWPAALVATAKEEWWDPRRADAVNARKNRQHREGAF